MPGNNCSEKGKIYNSTGNPRSGSRLEGAAGKMCKVGTGQLW
jgi:hypothetical protein